MPPSTDLLAGWPAAAPGWSALLDTAMPLAVLAALAVSARGVPRVLLAVQVVYWTLSFVGRPGLLLAVRPRPAFGDNIADPRLALGGYDLPISQVLAPVSTGLWVYTVLAAGFVLIQRLRIRALGDAAPDPLPRPSRTMILTHVALWGIGMLGRAASWATGTVGRAGEITAENPYLHIVTTLGALGALGLILFLRSDTRWVTPAVIAFALAGELGWSIMQESKTPFLGAVLALIIRLTARGVDRRTALGLVGASGVVLVAFGWLQSFKTTTDVAARASAAEASYPAALRPLLPVFRRFDLFEAATDNAFYHGPGYLDLWQLLVRAPLNLIPGQVGVAKTQSGVDWAVRVRGSSVDMSTVSVSLAEGHVNEGYRIAGMLGVTVESVLVLLMIAVVARCLRGTMPLVTIGVAFVALPPLFERGVLGITETLGKAVQQAALISALSALIWFAGELRRRRAGPAPQRPVAAPHPVFSPERKTFDPA